MRNIQAFQYKNQLDTLFLRIRALSGDIYLQSHWSRYLCVLVSGFIETSIGSIYSYYAQNSSAPNIANYVTKQLDQFHNPTMQKILNLTYNFNNRWGAALEYKCNGPIKAAIDSIAANRNAIAHGRNTQISYNQISDYYKKAIELLDFLEEQCDNG